MTLVLRGDANQDPDPAPVTVSSVDRLAEFAELVIQCELGRSALVSDQVVPLDDQLRIVPPFVRIADLGSEFGQFFEGPGFGLGGHPVERLDVDAIGFDQPLIYIGLEIFRQPSPSLILAGHRKEHLSGIQAPSIVIRIELPDGDLFRPA